MYTSWITFKMIFNNCPNCGRPLVNEHNLIILRRLILASTVVGGIAGFSILPLLGFGLAGITGGSIAASWQASIGAVEAGSLFAFLQSLGATGVGIVSFGTTTAAIGFLGSVAARLNWCTCKQQQD
jgi:hypothetical protein